MLIVTLLYFAATVWILFTMRAANKHARDTADKSLTLTRDTFEISHRPYLHVVSFVATRSAYDGVLRREEAADYIDVRVMLRNAGHSAAHYVMSWPSVNRQPRGNAFDVRWFTAKTPDHVTSIFSVGPGEDYEPDWPQHLDARGVEDDRSTTLYFACVIVHRDDFKNWHVYKFSYRYDPATDNWGKYRDWRTISPTLDEPFLKAAIEKYLRDNQA